MRTKELFDFIRERHSIYLKKTAELPKPWTNDPILRAYRFCNVYRELDTQTIWLERNWRTPNKDDSDFWFAALVFRFVNWNETAHELGYPVPFKEHKFARTLAKRMDRGEKVYSGAYMISTHGVKEPKNTYIANSLQKIWNNRETYRYRSGEQLSDFHTRLMNAFDVGSFLAAQVVADMKFAGDALKAKDWWSFAAPGPGSKRGLNRVMKRDKDKAWNEVEWGVCLRTLHNEINPLIAKYKMPRLSAQDLQNCLCEFDKIERARLCEGRPKSTYPGV